MDKNSVPDKSEGRKYVPLLKKYFYIHTAKVASKVRVYYCFSFPDFSKKMSIRDLSELTNTVNSRSIKSLKCAIRRSFWVYGNTMELNAEHTRDSS